MLYFKLCSSFAVPKITVVNKETMIDPAMVRCGESPRSATVSVRTPMAGFLFIPKITGYDKQRIELATHARVFDKCD